MDHVPGTNGCRRHPIWIVLLIIAFGVCTVLPTPTGAETVRIEERLCEAAAAQAAAVTGIPQDVLTAISVLSTSPPHDTSPMAWPWTVTVQGELTRFPSRDAAARFLNSTLSSGEEALKSGCFQVDLSRHASGFRDAVHSLDPKANAIYAARLLVELYREKGSWDLAAGIYHSRSVAIARAYTARFRALREGTDVPPPTSPGSTSRQIGAMMASTFDPSPPDPGAPGSFTSNVSLQTQDLLSALCFP